MDTITLKENESTDLSAGYNPVLEDIQLISLTAQKKKSGDYKFHIFLNDKILEDKVLHSAVLEIVKAQVKILQEKANL